jgi:DNA topoisomerase-1
MPRLRRVSPDSPGWTRRRRGKGFTYVDEHGQPLSADDVARVKALVIPPAWRDVWICPAPNGHIQAIGTDVAGRRQYLYHPAWREQRDEAKHARVVEVAARLPSARTTVAKHLATSGMPKERALALAFRLLDIGFFRVGGEGYTEENGSYGLATIEQQHVRIKGDQVVFDYVAKSGQERLVVVEDDAVVAAVRPLLRRRGGGPGLLAYKYGRTWRDVTSDDINAYVKEVVGGDVSSKDFRTWHGTVLAALALAELAELADDQPSPTRRKKAVSRAMKDVAASLGNTPTVARSAYVDPRVIERFEQGVTIEPTLQEARRGQGPRTRRKVERAVLELLQDEG